MAGGWEGHSFSFMFEDQTYLEEAPEAWQGGGKDRLFLLCFKTRHTWRRPPKHGRGVGRTKGCREEFFGNFCCSVVTHRLPQTDEANRISLRALGVPSDPKQSEQPAVKDILCGL